MRKSQIAALCLLGIWTTQLGGQSTGRAALALLTFQNEQGADCTAQVFSSGKTPTGAQQQTLSFSCGAKRLFTYTTEDSVIDLSLAYPHTDRVIARWEGASHVRLTVVHIAPNIIGSSVVFDETPDRMPDVVGSPDTILVHTGKRWIDDENSTLPTMSKVYTWTQDHYVMATEWAWSAQMRYRDRFCLLDVKPLACPASPLHTSK